MPRLPVPGSDDNQWGDILNDFLAVSHQSDGTLKDAVTNAQLTSHTTSTDPHASAAYAIMVGGGRRIYVQDTQPTGMAEGDIWIDTSGL